MFLKLNILRPEALALYQILSAAQELSELTLIGGTALALQLGHRASLDFDFATFKEELPVQKIDALVSRLKAENHQVHLITDLIHISQFKINTGKNLLHYARDYVINGVKVTFFAHGKTQQQREYFTQVAKIRAESMSFSLLGLDALKVAKTLVLADRVRSRDLFDLMILMQDCHYTMEEAVKMIQKLGHNDDPEYYKAVMTGAIPLDQEDEGLHAININSALADIYYFFDKRIEDYELKLAEDYL